MSRYNFQDIEKKWQKYWEDNKFFKTSIDKKKKEILLPRNVSLSFWQNSHGSCEKLYYR